MTRGVLQTANSRHRATAAQLRKLLAAEVRVNNALSNIVFAPVANQNKESLIELKKASTVRDKLRNKVKIKPTEAQPGEREQPPR
jgi:predicted DNA-binding protein (MmcQ/YjbR family)